VTSLVEEDGRILFVVQQEVLYSFLFGFAFVLVAPILFEEIILWFVDRDATAAAIVGALLCSWFFIHMGFLFLAIQEDKDFLFPGLILVEDMGYLDFAHSLLDVLHPF
jgi:hypothetical protein